MSTCNLCGQEIQWVRSVDGVSHPVDPPITGGWVWDEILRSWEFVQINLSPSHVETCPQGEELRIRYGTRNVGY